MIISVIFVDLLLVGGERGKNVGVIVYLCCIAEEYNDLYIPYHTTPFPYKFVELSGGMSA